MSPFPFPTACTCHFPQGWRPVSSGPSPEQRGAEGKSLPSGGPEPFPLRDRDSAEYEDGLCRCFAPCWDSTASPTPTSTSHCSALVLAKSF